MNRDLEQTIAELHKEARTLEPSEQDGKRERLEQLINQLEASLSNTNQGHDSEVSLDTLKLYITEFEVSHPRISAIINQLMLALNNMGI